MKRQQNDAKRCSNKKSTSASICCSCKNVSFIMKVMLVPFFQVAQGSMLANYFSHMLQQRYKFPGRIHFCSHSLIYVPDESKYPILCFAFDKFQGQLEEITKNALSFSPHKQESLVSFTCTQMVEMKKNDQNQPYLFRKVFFYKKIYIFSRDKKLSFLPCFTFLPRNLLAKCNPY